MELILQRNKLYIDSEDRVIKHGKWYGLKWIYSKEEFKHEVSFDEYNIIGDTKPYAIQVTITSPKYGKYVILSKLTSYYVRFLIISLVRIDTNPKIISVLVGNEYETL